MENKKQKYTTYFAKDTLMALKRFAVEKQIPIYAVIEAALKKCIPEKYWKGPGE